MTAAILSVTAVIPVTFRNPRILGAVSVAAGKLRVQALTQAGAHPKVKLGRHAGAIANDLIREWQQVADDLKRYTLLRVHEGAFGIA